jgi:serine/threonine protein kinase
VTSDHTANGGRQQDTGDEEALVRRGALLASRYRVGEVIGRGGMSTVYHGYDELLRRDVAVKVLLAPAAGSRGSRQEFLGEARAAAALAHPNIAGIYDVGIHGSERYIIMEYVSGGSLLDLIQAEAPMPLARTVQVATQVADALDYGHRHGIIHCDVKPQNVLLDETGRAKLVDFGISRTIAATGALTDTITGTAGYIAPEQLLGERLDGRADIYALGCVVYEMLTGALPFESSNLTALATQRLTRPPTPLRQRNPEVPPVLAESVMRALERDPEQRYRSANEFSTALAAGMALAHPTARTAVRPPTGELTRRHSEELPFQRGTVVERPPRKRRPVWPVALLVLLVIVLGATAAAIELPSLLSGSKGAVVGVPSVDTLSLDEAVQRLRSQHLAVDLTLRDTSAGGTCSGEILGESPPPGTQVPPGSTVTLLVSRNAQC